MVFRILVATLCLAAAGAVRADAVPTDELLVIGDTASGRVVGEEIVGDVAIGDAVIDEEGVPTELPEMSVVVEGPGFDAGDGMPLPGARVASCTTEPGGWASFTTFDVLFMDRTNTVGPLAVASASSDTPGAAVITAGDVRYPTTPGVRLFQGWRSDDCGGVEVGYLGIWGMHADALAVSPGGELAVPGALGTEIPGSGLDAATAIRPVLGATVNSFEVNVFATRVYDGCPRHDPLPWRRVGVVATADVILGLRWAGLDETATLDVTAAATTPPPPTFNTTAYRVTTSSHLVGPQVGYRRRVAWGDWAFEGWAKAALAGSFLSQSQSAVVGPADLVAIREPRSSTRMGVGLIGDLNATVIRRFGDHWGLRAGYTLLWFSGAAPAADQWAFTNDPVSSGTRLEPGTVFLHGATLGVEAAW